MFFTRTLFSICLLSASLVFVGFSLLLRSIPSFAELFGNMVRFLLKWSFHLYRKMIMFLDPFFQINLGVSAVELPTRAILSIALSSGIGCLIFLILRWQITWILLLICMIHGLTVALLWADFFEPQGLHIGEKL